MCWRVGLQFPGVSLYLGFEFVGRWFLACFGLEGGRWRGWLVRS